MKLMKFIATLIISLFIFTAHAYPESGEGVFSRIHSPEELVEWLREDFQFVMKIPDHPQSPVETAHLKTGDCDDFAKLASTVLGRMGIPNEVLLLRFEGLKNILHAICIWKNKDGTYSFMSNQKLHHTGKHNIEEAVKKFYPDCEKITRTF